MGFGRFATESHVMSHLITVMSCETDVMLRCFLPSTLLGTCVSTMGISMNQKLQFPQKIEPKHQQIGDCRSY